MNPIALKKRKFAYLPCNEEGFEQRWLEIFKDSVNGAYSLKRLNKPASPGQTVWDDDSFFMLMTSLVRVSFASRCTLEVGKLLNPIFRLAFDKADFEERFLQGLEAARNNALEFKRLSFQIIPNQTEIKSFSASMFPDGRQTSQDRIEFDGGADLIFDARKAAQLTFRIFHRAGESSLSVTVPFKNSVRDSLSDLFLETNRELDDILQAIVVKPAN